MNNNGDTNDNKASRVHTVLMTFVMLLLLIIMCIIAMEIVELNLVLRILSFILCSNELHTI